VAVVTAPDPVRARPARQPYTPARLRVRALSVGLTAAALLAATSLLMARTQDQVRIIGAVAAPQAATASDLYVALSDLDAQIARLVLINNTEELSSSQLDALSTYRERSIQIDVDLALALTTAATDQDRATIVGIMNGLALYRQWAWQALAVEWQLPPQPPGELPPAALGYYAQATNVLHFEVLPAVKRLRDASQARLDRAYADQRTTERWGIGLLVLLGGALVAQLAGLQLWLFRRFRRWLNPALLTATVVAAGLVVSAGMVFALEGARLSSAHRDGFAPYLALSQAQAISYDAAADASRYLLSANEAYQRDFADKSECLVNGGPCGTGGDAVDSGLAALAPDQGPELLDRWLGYEQAHEQVVGLADAGQTAQAIDALTGIRRGEAAFDFYYFDAAISELAAAREQAFDLAMRDAEGLLTGWSVIPVVAMAIVIGLLLLGVWPRLAEYR
jgi:hypothetical protein